MMKKRRFKIVIIVGSLLLLTLLLLQLRAKAAVESFLERKIPAHIALNYTALNVQLWSGKVQFIGVDVKIRDRDTTHNHTLIKVDELVVDGVNYSQFLFNNTIKATEVLVQSPQVAFYPSKTFRENSERPKGVVQLLKDIAIGKIAITNGSFDMAFKENDSIQVRAREVSFSLINGKTDPEIIKQKIPVVYDTYDFSAKKLFVDLGPFETVTADVLVVSETDAKLSNLVLQSKYSKAELSKVISKERDHIDLKVPECSLKHIDFGFKDENFFFASEYGEIDYMVLDVYRDKLVADDPTVKRMYSTALRELPLDIQLDSLALLHSKVTYWENVKAGTKAGKLFFDDLNLKLKNISNTYEPGNRTTANVNGKLMGVAPITLSYGFDINDKNDAFTLSTTLFGLDAAHVDSFLRPNLNAQLKGKVNELYFTVTGDKYGANGDIKMKYEDLKFEILKKDRLKINKVLSAIGNLFINDGSKGDAQGYRYGTIDVERDRTKSMFNYIWISTQDGLLNTLTGNGKKEKE